LASFLQTVLARRSFRYVHFKFTLLVKVTTAVQAAKEAIIALGSDIPKPEFIDLVAGWECFTRTGVALPDDTVQ